MSGSANNSSYVNDYALTVDCAGNDLYDNNAGGNLLDVQRGPSNAPWALQHAPARGCEQVREILGTEIANANCVPAASLLLDLSGTDTYGVRQQASSSEHDSNGMTCITDPTNTSNYIVRRIVTVGAGLAGVGELVDTGGDDYYTAKTASVGTGHVGGVGILSDVPVASSGTSNDTYLAIRNSEGFGFASGVGILRDEEGDDTYDHYMPAGGVNSDMNVCDATPRNMQGVGELGGTGVLVNLDGNDIYRANASSFEGSGGAFLGVGGGLGVFVDRLGIDTYICDSSDCPSPLRKNDTRGPTVGTGTNVVGIFIDDGDPGP